VDTLDDADLVLPRSAPAAKRTPKDSFCCTASGPGTLTLPAVRVGMPPG